LVFPLLSRIKKTIRPAERAEDLYREKKEIDAISQGLEKSRTAVKKDFGQRKKKKNELGNVEKGDIRLFLGLKGTKEKKRKIVF